MNINLLIQEKQISKYRLAKETNIPYTTISDICNGKTTLENCNAKTVYELAVYFDFSMEDLLYKNNEMRYDFETFKSNIRHELKAKGYKAFIKDNLLADKVSEYFQKKWHPEALYLLAMIDYLSRIHHVPLYTKYNAYRTAKLNETIYPADVIAEAVVTNDNSVYKESFAASIPEFTRFNIVENEVLNIA